MEQIKIFKTNNKSYVLTQDNINSWIEDEGVEVISISTSSGAAYKNERWSSFDEVEIFIFVLYRKIN